MKQIQIINGPNLNLLGVREPEIYGTQTFEDFFEHELRKQFPEVSLHYFQSNHEGDIIDKLHEIGFKYDGIILNAGAYTHYSYAIADAIKAITTKVIEVHISDVSSREDFRQVSYIRAACMQTISGHGIDGYLEAMDILCQ